MRVASTSHGGVKTLQVLSLFFFFLEALEFELRALHLLGRCSIT
jgi:hypothetical protein